MKKSILILLIIVLCILSAVVLKISLAFGFLIANIIVFMIASDKKASIKAGIKELYKCRILYLIILLLGGNIALWMASGILPSLVYYASYFIDKINFLFMTFISVALVSTVMGTGLGTFSTIGLVFIALSKPLGYPLPVIVGAIVSGAFIADKISPVSALTNLTIEITDIKYRDYLKESLKTLIPTVVITGIIYYILNGQYEGVASVEALQSILPTLYNITPLTLLVPIAMIVLSIIGVPILLNMISVTISCSLIALFYQKITFGFLIKSTISGYALKISHSDPMNQLIMSIFKGGGILPMVEVVIIVSLVVYLTGMMMSEKILNPIIEKLMQNTVTSYQLILKTGLLSFFLNSLTCDQTIGIVVPGEVLQSDYKRFDLSKAILARTISDTGTILAPLEFWNVNVIIISGLVGIGAVEYAPYAYLLFISPIITLVYTKLFLNKEVK